MNKNKNSNSGFTLIELIIAMAVLAFLMTAISSLMGSSIMSFKKTKADIRVHTSAQETYNQLTDSIMQANSIIIKGYTCGSDLDFAISGVDSSETPTLVYLVIDDDMKTKLIANPGYYGMSGANISNVKLFSEMAVTDKIYIAAMRIETSVPIDLNMATGANLSATVNNLTDNLDPTGTGTVEVKKISGKDVFNTYDTLVNTYIFDDESLYYGKKYRLMDKLTDEVNMADEKSKRLHRYSKSLSYVKADAGTIPITGCVAVIDSDAGAMGLDLVFNDRNMTYTTLGMVNTRNSYVLKARK